VSARIQPDGDLVVREERTLTFEGDFSYVYWEYLTEGSQGIVIRRAGGPEGPYERTGDSFGQTPGTYLVTDMGDRVRVELRFALADTAATFWVEYVAEGAAVRWADTAELYWAFVGDEAQIESDDVRIDVAPPAGVERDEVRAWAHGPLWGEVAILADATTRLTVSPLPAATFVEARIVFPAEALPRAEPRDEARLPAILAEEQELADQANRDRWIARVKVVLWGVLGIGLPLAALILVVWLWLRYGREPRTAFQAQYLRDFPDPRLPPALVSYIWEMGGVDQKAAMATLLDLVDRGAVAIERVVTEDEGLLRDKRTVDYRLTRRQAPQQLEAQERRLLDFLFDDIAGADSFLMGELKDAAKKKRAAWTSGYAGWKQEVEQEAERRHFLDAGADRLAFWAAAAGFAAAVAAGAAGIFAQYFWFFAGIPVGIGVVLAARVIKRRSQEAAELHAQYAAIRRYLKDFGRLQEKPPDAVVLWQHFLVLAVVFGIADEVIEHLQVAVPEIMRDPAFHTTAFLLTAPVGGDGRSAFAVMSGGFAAAMSAATSSSSSGGGGGGGFSGGGGGGGGGGGFGAG
jgi:uncharacterized membrane protein